MSRKPRRDPLAAFHVCAATIVALLSTAADAFGQEVALRGGEHAAFTRLVAELPQGTRWSLFEGQGVAEVRFTDPAPRIDLSQTFTRIPRTRVASVDLTPGGMRIGLACSCPVRAVEELPGLLVIDILDPPRAEPLQPPVARAAAEDPTPSTAAGRALAVRLLAAPGADGAGITALRTAPPPEAGENAFRTALRRAIRDAAAQGVLTRVPDSIAPLPHRDPATQGVTAPAHIPQMRIAAPSPATAGSPLQACLSPQSFAISDWGGGGPVHVQIAGLRSRLTGEFDRADRDAVQQLVRYYLYIGFGAEARALTRAFPVAIDDADVVRAMSHIVDHTLPPVDKRLADQAGCPHGGAFWALMSMPEGAVIEGLDTAATIRAFLDLPVHLRRSLGPGAVQRLVALGRTDAARPIRDATERAHAGADAADDPRLSLASVRIDLAAADAAVRARGDAALETLQTAASLTLRLERMAARGEPPERELLLLAESIAAEHRATPEGRALRAAQARASAVAGEFDAAFDAVRRLSRDAPTEAEALRNTLHDLLAQTEDDTRFVTAVFSTRPWENPQLAAQTRLVLGERLAAIGFPGHARALLADPELSGSARAAMARARSHLGEGDMQAALAALGRHGGPDVEAMREAIAEIDPASITAQARIAPAAVPDAVDVSAAVPAPSAQPDTAAPPTRDFPGLLGQGASALESGQDLRRRIEDMLSAPLVVDASTP